MTEVATVFIGGCGVGKSTLLNCYLGRPTFKAGASISGSGITTEVQEVLDAVGRGYFVDTPGLSCQSLGKDQEAAVAILQSLKRDKHYKLFFVVTLEAGRVRPNDKLVMKFVLSALPSTIRYRVIINKVSEEFKRTPTNLKTLITVLMDGLDVIVGEDDVYLLYANPELDGEDVVHQLPGDFSKFIEESKSAHIKPNQVKGVVDVTQQMFACREEMAKRTLELDNQNGAEFQKAAQRQEAKLQVQKNQDKKRNTPGTTFLIAIGIAIFCALLVALGVFCIEGVFNKRRASLDPGTTLSPSESNTVNLGPLEHLHDDEASNEAMAFLSPSRKEKYATLKQLAIDHYQMPLEMPMHYR